MRSEVSRYGILLWGLKSAGLPHILTKFLSQLAQFTGPSCFLLSMASSSDAPYLEMSSKISRIFLLSMLNLRAVSSLLANMPKNLLPKSLMSYSSLSISSLTSAEFALSAIFCSSKAKRRSWSDLSVSKSLRKFWSSYIMESSESTLLSKASIFPKRSLSSFNCFYKSVTVFLIELSAFSQSSTLFRRS